MVLLDHFTNKSNTFLSPSLSPISSLGLHFLRLGSQDCAISGTLGCLGCIYVNWKMSVLRSVLLFLFQNLHILEYEKVSANTAS